MLNDLIKQSGMSEVDILAQVRNDYDVGFAFAEPIRKEFDEETKLFNYQKARKNKVGDSTLFNVHSAMMAREYVDKPTSKFVGTYGQQNMVENLNATLEQDFNDSIIENLIYDWKHDKFLRGLGIIIRNGWDGEYKKPTFDIVDPRLAILDPDGNYRTGEYDFFGFSKQEYYKNIEKGDFINKEYITQFGNAGEAARVKDIDQENAKLSPIKKAKKQNPMVECYYHFGFFNGVKALVITTNNNSLIIKVKIYKENTRVKAFDDILAITYWRPRKNNPFGDRMARYVGDVQIVKSIIAGLRLDKIKAELYPMYVRNTRLIKNKGDLDFGFNKIIDANPLEGESIGNALVPVQRDLKTDQSYILDDSLDKQIEASTSIGKIAQGTSPERREAATTNQLIQDNTDINLAFTAKIDAIGYERLLKVWFEGYLEKFLTGDKKLVYIQTGYGNLAREFTKKDFLSDVGLRISIETQVEINEKKNKERVAYGQLIGYLQSIPNRPESAQLNTMRSFARAMDMSDEDIEIQIPATAQEIIAQENVGLLLKGLTVKVEDSYDPDTHLLAIKSISSLQNVAAYKYGLLKLKKIKGEQSMEQTNPAIANNLAAQASSSAINEANTL